MQQRKIISIAIATVLAASACSSTSQRNDSLDARSLMDEYMHECTFKDGTTPAPRWVCGYPLDEYPITETGYSNSALEAEARANALSKLAARIQTQVETNASQSTQTSNQRSRSEFEQVTRQVVNERLTNTRVLLRITDPSSNGLHILLVADEQAFEESIRQARIRVLD